MSETMRVMRAVKSGVIRQEEGRPRLMIEAGKTTAHAGNPIVRDHPHLWGELQVDFPAGDLVDAAVEDARPDLGMVQAVRDLLAGLVERGYELPDADGMAADEVAAAAVRVALNNLPAAGAAVNEADEGGDAGEGMVLHFHEGEDDECMLCGRPRNRHPDPTEREDDEPEGVTIGQDAEAADDGAADEPAAAVDETTKEGRAAIRDWAEEHGYEVHASGPLPAEVLDAWRRAQG